MKVTKAQTGVRLRDSVERSEEDTRERAQMIADLQQRDKDIAEAERLRLQEEQEIAEAPVKLKEAIKQLDAAARELIEEQKKAGTYVPYDAEAEALKERLGSYEKYQEPDPTRHTDAEVKVLEANLQNLAMQEAQLWVDSQPDYYPTRANFKMMTEFMAVNDMAPVRKNFAIAYRILSEDGLLKTKPKPAQLVYTEEQRNKDYCTKPVVFYKNEWLSQQQVDDLSADDYRKAMKIRKIDGWVSNSRVQGNDYNGV